MEISDSSSDDSLSFEEQIHLDTLSALAATTITTRLKEKMKTGLKSNVDSDTFDNDSKDRADISCEAGTKDIQFALNQKPLFDVLDTCNSSRETSPQFNLLQHTSAFLDYGHISENLNPAIQIRIKTANYGSTYPVPLISRLQRMKPFRKMTKTADLVIKMKMLKGKKTYVDSCKFHWWGNGDPSLRVKKNYSIQIQLASSLQCNIQSNSCYVTLNQHNSLQRMGSNARKDSEEEIMKKSVITDDFERKETIPPYEEGLRQVKKKRRLEREKTKGKNWFQMPAPEMTEERKHDLSILQMRKALDPKRFYKGNDIKALPRYFQFGEVVETPADFYHARIPKKHRKATIVDELLADVETRKYNKRKYTEIQEAKRKSLGPYRHMKRLKKKKH